jgi:hypothetical protein
MTARRSQRAIFRVPRVPETPREHLRIAPPATADFVSQQLLERELPWEILERRHAAMGEALSAYDKGARIAVRRMPAGYRRTIVT